jgi:hypothetical protein
MVEASRHTIVEAAYDALSQGSERSKHSIASKTSAEVPQKIRWEIRGELSKKVDPETGEKLYQPFYRKDRETSATQYVQGVQAVPWRAVDDYIAERQAVQQKRHNELVEQREKESMEKRSREQRETYLVTRDSTTAFPTLGSATKTRATCWGSKPSSVGSSDGVEALNEAARKERQPKIQRRKAVSQMAVPTMVDLGMVLPCAPTRQMVDLTTALLPSGPRQLDLSDMDRAYEEFLAAEEHWEPPVEDEDGWWNEDCQE